LSRAPGCGTTLHPDSHELTLADEERMSDSNGAAYIQWAACGGTGEFVWSGGFIRS